MLIGERRIGSKEPCYIIAEAGTNFCHITPTARYGRAVRLVEAAQTAGADAIKFQLFGYATEELFCPLDGDYDRWSRWDLAHLAFDEWYDLKKLCERSYGITFLASAFQPTTVRWLGELEVRAYKVASRAADTYPYDDVPGPFIVSTGMGVPETYPIDKELCYLQCRSEYPTPLEKARKTNSFGGLSDHSGTIWPGLDAMARGCEILEVHFNIEGFDAGPDEPVCLTPEQLKLLCDARDNFHRMQ